MKVQHDKVIYKFIKQREVICDETFCTQSQIMVERGHV